MEVSTLLADPKAIRLVKVISDAAALTMVVSTMRPMAVCPRCSRTSARVHSRYLRTVADLPWHGVSVRLELHTRRFFCINTLCQQSIFCERLPSVVARYARKTERLTSALELIGFALGGEAGARVARELGMSVSPDTLLARIRRAALSEPAAPRVLGVDDWAKRKAFTYGTILVDLERRRVLDLLPDREGDTLAAWLKHRPGIEVISRDRGGTYADGVRKGAPHAEQVADRWHLLKNLGDALERMVSRQHDRVREVCNRLQAVEREREAAELVEALTVGAEPTCPADSDHYADTAARRRRLARYAQVIRLYDEGVAQRAIARRLGLARNTVRDYIRAGSFPETARRGPRLSPLIPFVDYLKRRFSEGVSDATRLWREIKDRGYAGSVCTVRRYVSDLRARLPSEIRDRLQQRTSGRAPRARLPVQLSKSPREVVWLLLRRPGELKTDERYLLEELFASSPDITSSYVFAQQFLRVIRERRAEGFDWWLRRASRSVVQEINGFASGLLSDIRAVRAALTSQWSQGQVEGQVNRLKMIKRQMYGRANFDLLRARVLHAV